MNATYTADQGIAALELAIRLNHDIATEQFYDQGGTRQKLRDAHARLYAIADQFFRSHTGFESFDAVLAAAGAQNAYTPTFHEDYGNDRVHSFLAQAFDYAAELNGLKVRAYRPERSPRSQSGILGLPPFPKGPLTSELVRVASQTADLVRNGAIAQAVSYAESQHLSAKASQFPDRHVEFLKRIEDGAKRLLKHPGYWEFTFTDATGAIVERLVIHESERGEFARDVEAGKVEWLKNPAIVRHERGWPWNGLEAAGTRFWKQCPTVKEGDWWQEHINQGHRDGQVVAVDVERGQYLWEYEMPKGTTGLVLYGWKRGIQTRRVVSYNSLSDRWLRLLAGFNGLIGNPQGGAREFQARWKAFVEAAS